MCGTPDRQGQPAVPRVHQTIGAQKAQICAIYVLIGMEPFSAQNGGVARGP
jgi:hypothetical protein